ncbi:MAG: hypothetical protein ABI237_05960 [Ginsengibacter sp.]
MGKGLAYALLVSSMEAFKDASPMEKITPYGYMQYLLNNTKPNVINSGIDDGSGYIRDVKIRYMQRSVLGQSVTTDNCSVQTRSAYLESSVPATMFRALGIAFDNDQISKFQQDALQIVQRGTPPTPMMQEVWDAIINQANGFFGDINNDLLTMQSTNFGKNATTGSNTAKAINFALNATNNDLTQGMTQVLADAMINESKMAGSSIVGSGLILNYSLQQQAKGFDQAGVNTKLLQLPNYLYDPYSSPTWGANNFGLFQKDAVQLINICRFRGAKAGLLGGDYFFTLKLPIMDSVGQGSYQNFEFDVQLTYRNCVEEVQIGTYDADTNPPVQLARGWNIILMSSYAQVNIPADSYQTADRLFGNNGTYLYHATNT